MRNERCGSVFVFVEGECGIRRWTDGKLWSPSRIFGHFLVYKQVSKRNEMNKESRNEQDARKDSKNQKESTNELKNEQESEISSQTEYENSSQSSTNSANSFMDPSSPSLVKKTISISFNRCVMHIVCYSQHLTMNNPSMSELRPSRNPLFLGLALSSAEGTAEAVFGRKKRTKDDGSKQGWIREDYSKQSWMREDGAWMQLEEIASAVLGDRFVESRRKATSVSVDHLEDYASRLLSCKFALEKEALINSI